VGAHHDRAALKATSSRLTLLSPLLTFLFTLLLTLPLTLAWVVPITLQFFCAPSSQANAYNWKHSVESFLGPNDRLLAFASGFWLPSPSNSLLDFSSHGVQNGVRPRPWPPGYQTLSRKRLPSAAVSPASTTAFPRSSRARPFFLLPWRVGGRIRRTIYGLELRPMVTREEYMPKLTKSVTQRNMCPKPRMITIELCNATFGKKPRPSVPLLLLREALNSDLVF